MAPTQASPRRTLIIGGARSGKSLTAERLLAAEPSVVFVATARHDAADAEWNTRIAAHRSRRPSGWSTVETTDLAALLRALDAHDAPLLIDCLTLWLTHVLEDVGAWSDTSKDAERAYRRLMQKGLVHDPLEYFFAPGVAIAALGLVPFRFTLVTENGRIKKGEIEAKLYEINFSNLRGTKKLTIEIRVAALMKALKPALVNALKALLEKLDDSEGVKK